MVHNPGERGDLHRVLRRDEHEAQNVRSPQLPLRNDRQSPEKHGLSIRGAATSDPRSGLPSSLPSDPVAGQDRSPVPRAERRVHPQAGRNPVQQNLRAVEATSDA